MWGEQKARQMLADAGLTSVDLRHVAAAAAAYQRCSSVCPRPGVLAPCQGTGWRRGENLRLSMALP